MKKLHLGNLTLLGRSSGGVGTSLVLPELKLCFDLGVIHNSVLNCNDIFISHCHTDHLGELFNFLAQRHIQNRDMATFYVPPSVAEPMAALIRDWSRFSATTMDFRIFAVYPNAPVLLRNQYRITPFPLQHSLETYGYLVERLAQKLKPQFRQLPSGDIQRLREEDPASIFDMSATPVFAYVPDTMAGGLESLPDAVWKAEVLALECTWLHPVPEEKMRKGQHLVMESLPGHIARFTGNHLVLFHLSTAHSMEEAEEAIQSMFPEELRAKTQLIGGSD